MDALRKLMTLMALLIIGQLSMAQLCNEIGQANDFYERSGNCAPVSIKWRVKYKWKTLPVNAVIEFEFDWGDGSPLERVTPAMLTYGTDSVVCQIIQPHIYVEDPIIKECVYQPSVRYYINGLPCTNSQQLQTIKVYNTDDKNSNNQMVIDPAIFTICVGNDGLVTFMDKSIWNCEPPDQQSWESPNNAKRWIQWAYGTNAGDPLFISDALVDGLPRTFPFETPVEETFEPIFNPEWPWNTSKPIYVNNTRLVNDWFEIELRNWNQCNPYDQGFEPIRQKAIIVIVGNPDATINPAGPFCANSSNVTLTSVTAGGIWSGPGITNTATGRFSPSAAGPGSHVITYTVSNLSGCSDTKTRTIVVNEVPAVNVLTGPQINLCPGAMVQLDGNPSGGLAPYTHLWTGSVAPLNGVNIQNPEFQTVVLGNYGLTYRVTDSNGCTNTGNTNVVVDYISIGFDKPVIDVCANTPVALLPQPTGGSGNYIQHLWSGARTDLLSATNIESPVFDSPSSGSFDYTYYVRDNQGCEATGNIKVEVRELPTANAGTDDTVCGLSYTLAAIPSMGNGFWELVSGPGTVTLGNNASPNTLLTVSHYGTYTLSWREDNLGCTDVATVNITFVRTPTPVAMDDASICGLSYLLVVNPDIGGVWSQVSGPGNSVFDNNTSASTSVTVDVAGTYRYMWFEDNGNGCVGNDMVDITFYPIPQAALGPFDNLGCNPMAITFNNLTTNADNYVWDFGNGYFSTQASPSQVFENLTQNLRQYTVKLNVSNTYGCKDSLKFNIEVAPTPKSRFLPDVIKGCSPLSVNFTNQSTGATNFSWDFGDGSLTDINFNSFNTFINNNSYVEASEVSLAVSNPFGCVDTSKVYITIYPNLNIDFTAVPQEGCSPMAVVFTATPGAQFYDWDFGDGSQLSGTLYATKNYTASGNLSASYSVTLNSQSVFGCKNIAGKSVLVHPSPVADFLPGINSGCHPVSVAFSNQSTGAVKSWWKLEDGTIFETSGTGGFQHQFTNTTLTPVWYKIKLVVENAIGCRDSVEKQIEVLPDVGASIMPADAGCSPHAAMFVNTTKGASTFVWDYGDGQTSTGFIGSNVYTFNALSASNVQRFVVTMIATSYYGCVDTAYAFVDVLPTPKADFTADPVLQSMPNSTVTFTNQTDGSGWNYAWRFGDGNTSAEFSPVHQYSLSGVYNVWLKASGGVCADSIARVVRILPMVPLIDYGPNAEGCPPLTVEFYNRSTDSYSFLWEFGDNTSSNESEPVHTYTKPGTYKVKLTADGPGGRSVANSVEIVVYDAPRALFDLDPRVTIIPDESVKFRDRSTGNIVSWTWDFGDGEMSSETNPTHKYTAEGVYDVRLLVVNDKGCPDDYTMTEAVRAKTGGRIAFPNAFTPSNSGPSGGVYNDIDRDNSVFFPFTKEGIIEYRLQIYTRWGELIFESKDINIGWDGYFKGKLAAMGVYVWTARVKFSDGRTQTFTGDVTLLR